MAKMEDLKDELAAATMAVAGFADPQTHRLCVKCRQWLPKETGMNAVFEKPLSFGFIGGLMGFGRLVSGYRTSSVFECHRCQRRRAMRQKVLLGLFAGLVGGVLILEYMGLIQ